MGLTCRRKFKCTQTCSAENIPDWKIDIPLEYPYVEGTTASIGIDNSTFCNVDSTELENECKEAARQAANDNPYLCFECKQ